MVSVKEQFTEQYGNASFYISDDGTTAGQFLVFRTYYLGNQKWTEGQSTIKVGDEVIVYGKLTVYMDELYETAAGTSYLVSLNGLREPNKNEDNSDGGSSTEDSSNTSGDGTLENPFNSVAAIKEAKKLASGEVSQQGYYIKGKVVSVKEQFTEQYGNASFYISDDGMTAGQFLVFRTYYLGNQKWTEGQSTIKVGDEVVVYGKLTVYMDELYETAAGTSYLVSLNGLKEPNKNEDNSGGGSTTEDDGWVSVTASGYAPYYYCPTDRTTTPSRKVPTSNLRAYKNKSTGAYKVNWGGRDYPCHRGFNKLTLGTYSHTTQNAFGKIIVCTDYQYFEFTISD